jgi:hypothetical protein
VLVVLDKIISGLAGLINGPVIVEVVTVVVEVVVEVGTLVVEVIVVVVAAVFVVVVVSCVVVVVGVVVLPQPKSEPIRPNITTVTRRVLSTGLIILFNFVIFLLKFF